MTLRYVIGDATQPQGEGAKILVHVCNDIGAWGRGFVLPLAKRFPETKRAYKLWATGATDQPFELGQVQFVRVRPDLEVANLIGQHDIARKNTPTDQPPMRYEAIRAGLAKVRERAEQLRATLHMPRIGAGVAGGEWDIIAGIVHDELVTYGLETTVYDLPTSPDQTS